MKEETRFAAVIMFSAVAKSSLIDVDPPTATKAEKTAFMSRVEAGLAANRGRLIDRCNDSQALVEFPTVDDALNCALAIHADTNDARKRGENAAGVSCRITLDAGEITTCEDGDFGEPIRLALQLNPWAEAGVVLMTGAAADCASVDFQSRLRPAESRIIKGYDQPVELLKLNLLAAQGKKEQPYPFSESWPNAKLDPDEFGGFEWRWGWGVYVHTMDRPIATQEPDERGDAIAIENLEMATDVLAESGPDFLHSDPPRRCWATFTNAAAALTAITELTGTANYMGGRFPLCLHYGPNIHTEAGESFGDGLNASLHLCGWIIKNTPENPITTDGWTYGHLTPEQQAGFVSLGKHWITDQWPMVDIFGWNTAP